MSQDPREDTPGEHLYGQPPQNSERSYHYSPQDGSPIPDSPPLKDDLRRLPGRYWRVLTKPGTRRFVEEAWRGQWDIVWMQLLIYSILVGILYYIGLLLSGGLSTWETQSAGAIALPAEAQHILEVASSFAIIVLIPIAFFFWQGVIFVCSRMLGGHGLFVQQGYASTLYWIPLGIISSVLGALPFINGDITLIITAIFGCYQLVLTFFMLKAVHHLSTGRAIGALLLPTFVIFIFAICAFASLYAINSMA